jgi:hypothetical protein
MKVFSELEAQQNIELVLKEASRSGVVGIRQKNGQTFFVRPERSETSPLDVPGVKLPISTPEIIGFIHEGRREG